MNKKWWHDKVGYQIYPKSFYDTNGDGIGDIRGIINKVDYLKNLGIDILWLSPIYLSPGVDEGYDISDYYSIDPKYGTMDDMDELIAVAKKLDMHIVMDLVVNHCSTEHMWFKNAVADLDSEYADYFYIYDMIDGVPPTNWRSAFGGSTWEQILNTDKCYLHTFSKGQADLNWRNAKLRAKIYEMMNWWLDKGVSGFRIDAIINLKKTDEFISYPPDREDGTCSYSRMLAEADGIEDLLSEMKNEVFDKHDAFTIGEIYAQDETLLGKFVGEEKALSTIFDFTHMSYGYSEKGWYDRQDITPKAFMECIVKGQAKSKRLGYLATVLENHDRPRAASTFLPEQNRTIDAKKMLAGMYICLYGMPFIYQGQEIGMENMPLGSINDCKDINSFNQYDVGLKAGLSQSEALKAVEKYARDNTRTPMQWSADQNSGFTDGVPWMKINDDFTEINVASQLEDSRSLYNFYRKLLAVRKDREYANTLIYGEFLPIDLGNDNVIAYYRTGEKRLLIIANYQACDCTVKLETTPRKLLINNLEYTPTISGKDKLSLMGNQFVLYKMEEK